MERNDKLRIVKSIRVEDINPRQLSERVASRSGVSEKRASKLVRAFVSRLKAPFDFSWFEKRVSSRDETIISALCELNGCDQIGITHSYRSLGLGLPISGVSRYQFSPANILATTHALHNEVSYEMKFLGRTLTITSLWQLALFQLALFLIGVLFYVLSVGVLLYGVSVVSVFALYPGEMGAALLQEPEYFLAVLSLLLASAVLFGRVARRVFGKKRFGRA